MTTSASQRRRWRRSDPSCPPLRLCRGSWPPWRWPTTLKSPFSPPRRIIRRSRRAPGGMGGRAWPWACAHLASQSWARCPAGTATPLPTMATMGANSETPRMGTPTVRPLAWATSWAAAFVCGRPGSTERRRVLESSSLSTAPSWMTPAFTWATLPRRGCAPASASTPFRPCASTSARSLSPSTLPPWPTCCRAPASSPSHRRSPGSASARVLSLATRHAHLLSLHGTGTTRGGRATLAHPRRCARRCGPAGHPRGQLMRAPVQA
mmetsp:Transcript_5931/g.16177  ORF Transcript_5931/g.16177 Transcript_5931/m.16177 type:complete len:265 (-) Transcript_5931:945-1739(-)